MWTRLVGEEGGVRKERSLECDDQFLSSYIYRYLYLYTTLNIRGTLDQYKP